MSHCLHAFATVVLCFWVFRLVNLLPSRQGFRPLQLGELAADQVFVYRSQVACPEGTFWRDGGPAPMPRTCGLVPTSTQAAKTSRCLSVLPTRTSVTECHILPNEFFCRVCVPALFPSPPVTSPTQQLPARETSSGNTHGALRLTETVADCPTPSALPCGRTPLP